MTSHNPGTDPLERQSSDRSIVRPSHPWLLVGAFVVLVFCTGTAEYLVAGVLSQLASEPGISVATATRAVSAYALGLRSAIRS